MQPHILTFNTETVTLRPGKESQRRITDKSYNNLEKVYNLQDTLFYLAPSLILL